MTSRPKITAEADNARTAAARSALYGTLARLLTVPSEEIFADLAGGEAQRKLSEPAAELDYGLAAPSFQDAAGRDFAEFQAEYIAFFELGKKSPPCPLYEGAMEKGKSRKSVMEELLRFYSNFGVKMKDEGRELPDYLPTQLEFMHYLAFIETGVIEGSGAARIEEILLAQRDFVKRHPAKWAPELKKKAGQKGAPPTYAALIGFIDEFIAKDMAYLEKAVLERPPRRE